MDKIFPTSFEMGHSKIAVQNRILAKINDKTISMIDVKKKLDLLFMQNYPQLADSAQARLQFYEAGWRTTLMQLIDIELMLFEASQKEVKLSDGEVREEMNHRFGPHIFEALDKIGLDYDEALKMVKDDMIVQRMNWWFVQYRAMQKVTPEMIKRAYKDFLKANPSFTEYKYQIISIRSERAEEIAQKVHELIQKEKKSPSEYQELFLQIDPQISISAELTLKENEISENYKKSLLSLEAGQYSLPAIQKGKTDHQKVARIFYLWEKKDHQAPSFHDVSTNLKNELIQKQMVVESKQYMEKLRKNYGFDENYFKTHFPDHFHPFSIQ